MDHLARATPSAIDSTAVTSRVTQRAVVCIYNSHYKPDLDIRVRTVSLAFSLLRMGTGMRLVAFCALAVAAGTAIDAIFCACCLAMIAQ